MNTQPVQLNTRKSVEMFIRKAILIIFNSRMRRKVENDGKPQSVCTSFLLNQQDNEDIDDIFLEDYNELLHSNKNEISMNSYIIEIYFKRKEFKVLIEKWTFNYLDSQKAIKISTTYNCNKKLAVMLRSLYVLSRSFPAYHFHVNSKDCSFDYRLFAKLENQNSFAIEKTSKVEIGNSSIMNLIIQLEYITINDISQLEEKYYKERNEYLIGISALKQIRPRCFSVNENMIPSIDQNNNPFREEYSFDSGGNCSCGNKGNNILQQDHTDYEQEEVIEDILFQNDDEGINTQEIKDIEIDNAMSKCIVQDGETNESNLSNKAVLQSLPYNINNNSLISDTLKGFKKLKEKSFNVKKTTSNEVKLMKTSDTSSSFVSDDSFQLDFDESESKSNIEEISNNVVINEHTSSLSVINTDFILYQFNALKSLMQKKNTRGKIRMNVHKLAEIYITVLNNKY